MDLIQKAKQLYLDCGNCNPNESTLMSYQVPWFDKKDIYQTLLVSLLINDYALMEIGSSEWVEKATIYEPHNKDDRKSIDRTLYKLVKKGVFELKEIDNKKYYRLTDKIDGLFDCENYRTREMA